MKGGESGYYLCQGVVRWFRFADGTTQRKTPGLCAVRPGQRKTLEDANFEQTRMGLQGCLTDMIKNAASTLGPRLGLGLNDQLLRPRLISPFKPESAEESHESLFPQTKAKPKGRPNGNGGNGSGAGWIADKRKRGAFWASVHDRGLTNEFVHNALGVESLKEYQGSITDAWLGINAAISDGMEAGQDQAPAQEEMEIPF